MFGPFKKEKPFQGLAGFGGGATGLANHVAGGGGHAECINRAHGRHI